MTAWFALADKRMANPFAHPIAIMYYCYNTSVQGGFHSAIVGIDEF
jgi:hypothetical protein